MSNIFQLNQQFLEVMADIEENEGVLTPEFEEALLSNIGDFNEKVENCVKMIRHWEGEIDTIDAEIERLSKMKKAKNTSIESLKNNIHYSLTTRGIEKLSAGTNTLSFRKSEAVIVTNPEGVPDQFIETKEVQSIDKTALKAWLKSGNETDSAHIEVRQNLQIK